MRAYVAEDDLEAQVRAIVEQIRRDYSDWADPAALCRHLGLRVEVGVLSGQDGAAIDDVVILNSGITRYSRLQFTYYHEIVHHLIRGNDALYSLLHDQYPDDESFRRIIERLANAGAAEFLVPHQLVDGAIHTSGFAIARLPEIMQQTPASPTAILVALTLRATHRCIGLVCRVALEKSPSAPSLPTMMHRSSTRVLQVERAVRSRTMKYGVAQGTPIRSDHLVFQALIAPEGAVLAGSDLMPFRAKQPWVVACEAMRLGQQVFAFFHADPVPMNQLPGQLQMTFS